MNNIGLKMLAHLKIEKMQGKGRFCQRYVDLLSKTRMHSRICQRDRSENSCLSLSLSSMSSVHVVQKRKIHIGCIFNFSPPSIFKSIKSNILYSDNTIYNRIIWLPRQSQWPGCCTVALATRTRGHREQNFTCFPSPDPSRFDCKAVSTLVWVDVCTAWSSQDSLL